MTALIWGLSKSEIVSLGLVISFATIYYVYKLRHKIVLPGRDGMIRLRPNLVVGIAGLTCCLSYLALVLYAISMDMDGLGNVGVGPKVIGCILLFPVFLFGYYHLRLFLFHRIEFDKKKLIVSDLYGKNTELLWSSLIGVEHRFSLLLFRDMC